MKLFSRRGPRDQANRLRDLVRETTIMHDNVEGGPPLTLVIGSKGGVGVSTLTLQLAKAIGPLGPTPVVVDANPWQADLRRLVNAHSNSTEHSPGLFDVLTGRSTGLSAMQDVLATSPHKFSLVAGGSNHQTPDYEQLAELGHFRDTLGNDAQSRPSQQGASCHLLVDAGVARTPWSQTLWHQASQILLVTRPETSALLDTYACLKVAANEGLADRFRVVVNVAADSDARDLHRKLAGTCREFLGVAPQFAGSLAYQEVLTAGFNDQAPPPQVRALAKKLLSKSELRIDKPSTPQPSPQVRSALADAVVAATKATQ